jgi:hypothetical protein
MRKITVKKGRPERGHSSPVLCRNRRITAAVTADAGDELRRPGGDFESRSGGEMERMGMGLNSHGRDVDLGRV